MSKRAMITLYGLLILHIGLMGAVLYGLLICDTKHEVRHTHPPALQRQETEPESAGASAPKKGFRNLDAALASAVRQAVSRATQEAVHRLVDEVAQSLFDAAVKVFYVTALTLLCWHIFCIVLLLCRRSWGYLFLWLSWAAECAGAVAGAILLLAVLQEIRWPVVLLPGLSGLHALCLILLYWWADVKDCVFWKAKAAGFRRELPYNE